jgi:PleD family two-component response regulator
MDRHKALVIDDDVDIANLFGMILNLAGYDCDIANSARDGLSRLAIYNPDLVLLDMQLDTTLGGQDILYQIRANPRLSNTRVIVVTGYPSMAEPIASQVDFTLIKPIDIDKLKAVLSKLKSSAPVAKPNYFCDPVTGMYNQDFFYTRLEHAVQRAKRRTDFIFAVCLVLVNPEQTVSKNLDEPIIFNTILREATQSLVHNLRPTDTVARLSHFKFATLTEELKSPKDVDIIANRIRTILTPPFRVENRNYALSFKIGKATSADFYEKADEILTLAERNIQ